MQDYISELHFSRNPTGSVKFHDEKERFLMVCPRCGHDVTGAFCSNCGTPATLPLPSGRQTFQQFQVPPGQQNRDNKIIPLICLIGVAVFAVIFLVYFGIVLFMSVLPILFAMRDYYVPYGGYYDSY